MFFFPDPSNPWLLAVLIRKDRLALALRSREPGVSGSRSTCSAGAWGASGRSRRRWPPSEVSVVDPTELCQWLKKKTRNDVKIVGSDHNQKMILVHGSSSRTGDTTPSAPTLPDHLSWALAPSGIQSGDEDLQLIEEKIRDLEKARDTLKIKNLKNELIAAKCELKQSREVISNGKKALLDSALNQLKAYKKLESLSQSLCD